MIVDFSKIDQQEYPVMILKNAAESPLGILGYAKNISADIKFNETSVLEFELPFQVDGVKTPHYDSVIGMRIIDIDELGQFILVNPSEVGDGIKKIKNCKAYSLEYEFTFKKITLENSTYNFWDPTSPSGTIIGEILDIMPSWGVGHIDSSLIGKYRTFNVSDINLYNFIKSTIQQSYNCIFDFDTRHKVINVLDASSSVPTNPVYLSNSNLAKEIKVTENTENIITRLDVNGSEGVNIRSVNPSGTNTIINLDYFMSTDNFSQSLIDKYYAWKKLYESYQAQYYNLSVSYSMRVMQKTTESAMLTELKNDLVSLENQQAVIIQSIAQNLKTQYDLDQINSKISAKESEILAKEVEIASVESSINSIYFQLQQINKATRFESYFSEEEYLQLDKYIKDDSVSESSFVVVASDYYSDSDSGSKIANEKLSFTDSSIAYVENTSSKKVYSIQNGSVRFSGVSAHVINATIDVASDAFLMTAYLSNGMYNGTDFTNACLSVYGTISGSVSISGSTLTSTVSSGYLYFTLNTNEYQKQCVSWELYKYGKDVLEKVSQPSYEFSITSANFLCLDDFVLFKNSLRHGQKIYIELDDNKILSPICIGVKFRYDSWNELSLEFGDTYTSTDSTFLLTDLLEKSISMGKDVDLNKYTYSAFVDSGASSEVKTFMTTALDVSKNAIMSSKDQAISWGDSGIRLRKWANDAHTSYDPKQVWLNNNSILMTSANWATAEIAIGNFYDKNLGDCWGIVAPNIVGTLLAGQSLVIESEKRDGSNAVFRVDANGCVLYNSIFEVLSKNKATQIAIDPQLGIVVGKNPVYTIDSNGVKTVNTDNARFWADTNGNLTFQGTLRATTGEFDGKVTAREGYIGDSSRGWTIKSTYIYNGRNSLSSDASGVYIGTDGISLGNGTNLIKATASGAFTANNATITGNITAISGKIGGFTIDGESIKYNNLSYGTTSGSGVYIGPSGLQLGPNFRVDADGNLTANSGIFTGSIYAGNIVYGGDYGYLHGDGIQSESVSSSRLGSGSVTSGKIAGGAVGTSKVTDGINASLGYADFSNEVFSGVSYAGCVHTYDLIASRAALGSASATSLEVTNSLSGGNTRVSSLSIGGSSVTKKSISFTDGDGDTITINYWG